MVIGCGAITMLLFIVRLVGSLSVGSRMAVPSRLFPP